MPNQSDWRLKPFSRACWVWFLQWGLKLRHSKLKGKASKERQRRSLLSDLYLPNQATSWWIGNLNDSWPIPGLTSDGWKQLKHRAATENTRASHIFLLKKFMNDQIGHIRKSSWNYRCWWHNVCPFPSHWNCYRLVVLHLICLAWRRSFTG